MSENVIIYTGAIPGITLAGDSSERRALVLADASEVEAVESAEQQAVAVGVCRNIKALVNSVESARKVVKKPVLDLGKAIDRVAEEYTAQLEAEYGRITKLVGGFQEAEAKRVAEEQAKRDRELAELRAKEEAARLAAEAANAALAKPDATEADLNKAVAAEQAVTATGSQFTNAVLAPPPSAIREEGMAVRRPMRFEVTDIHALYRHNPNLVRLEPNRSAINEILVPGVEIPGLRAWQESAISIRA